MNAYCSYCDKDTSYTIRKNIITEYKGYKVDVEENIAICDVCKNDMFVEELEDKNLDLLYETYRKKADIISVSEIKTLRDKYSISQRELVNILNWGKMTVNRYENGALPDESHNQQLKLIFYSQEAFLKKSEEALVNGRITNETYNKIANK